MDRCRVAGNIHYVAISILLAIEFEIPVAILELFLEPRSVSEPLVVVGTHEVEIRVYAIVMTKTGHTRFVDVILYRNKVFVAWIWVFSRLRLIVVAA